MDAGKTGRFIAEKRKEKNMSQKELAKCFSYISLSFTALTLCAYYSLAKQWVLTNAADQLLDVMPTLSDVLWFLTIASVMLNGICLFAISLSEINF